jgi:hypothetical protein
MTRPAKPINHGTYGGYQIHHRRGIEPCEDCQKAHNAYMAAFRAEGTEGRQRNREAVKAGELARRELAQEFPEEYQRLYAKHLGILRGVA